MFSQIVTQTNSMEKIYKISKLLPEYKDNQTALAKALEIDRGTFRKHMALGDDSHVILKSNGKYHFYAKTRLR